MSPHRTLIPLGALLFLTSLSAGPFPASMGGGPSGLSAQQRDPAPRILVLGTPHMAQSDRSWRPDQVRRVQERLRAYAPDMVVVEHLPPQWSRGRGRDYRPGFDLASYAQRWEISRSDTVGACRRAQRFFLRRDLANAAYHWLAADYKAESEAGIAEWIARWSGHEMARIAFPVARASGLSSVVSFDYQGDDARWFLDQDFLDETQKKGSPEERVEADSLEAAISGFRKWAAAHEEGSLMDILRARNSREWMEAQRRLYEEVMPRLSYDDAGARQTENYWRRNRRMFDRIDKAAEERAPDRILVVVGAGHKYFLDELARRRGYRWVDPLKYLKAGSRPSLSDPARPFNRGVREAPSRPPGSLRP